MDKHTHMSDLKIRIKLTPLVVAGIRYDAKKKSFVFVFEREVTMPCRQYGEFIDKI